MAFKGKGLLVSVVIAGVFAGIGISMSIAYDKNLEKLALQLNALEAQLEEVKADNSDASTQVVTAVTGADYERMERDGKIIESFLDEALTWSSSAEYELTRQSILKEYNLDEESSFFKIFMPPDLRITQKDGTVVSYIDTHGSNCMFESVQSMYRGAVGTTYRYFGIVEWSAADSIGQEAVSEAIILYEVDSDGGLHNLEGYSIAQ